MIAIDVAGLFPTTANNNKYILVADYFSKWTETYAILNHEASTVARVLVDYLVPLELHSDQEKTVESSIFQKLCRLYGYLKNRKEVFCGFISTNEKVFFRHADQRSKMTVVHFNRLRENQKLINFIH